MNPSADHQQHAWSFIREHNFRQSGLVAALLAVPFLADGLRSGFGPPHVLAVALILLFALLTAAGREQQRRWHGRDLLLGTGALAIAVLAWREDAVFAWLAGPLIFTLHFALERRPALILNVLLLAGLLPALVTGAADGSTLTAAGSLLLCSALSWYFAHVVAGQLRGLEEQVATDALTGAWNRRRFNERLEELARRRSRHGHPVSLIIFDIDHFKRINDQHGHEVGDRVLRILIETVKARVRLTDEVFRYGGEEFVVLLPDTVLEPALKLAQDLTDMVAAVRIIEGGPVTISCGVGELGEEEKPGDWLRRCDVALYQAKNSGRGRVCRAPDQLTDGAAGSVLDLDQPPVYRAQRTQSQ